MNDWRAFYTDDRQFTSEGTVWTGLPETGVLGVVVYHDAPYRELVYGGDWYWLDDATPVTGATAWDGWVEKPDAPEEEIKQGSAVPDDRWRQVETELMEARTWP